ncbi:MAG: hypothetical protein ACRD2P_07650 [Terriglobia bacterium]
MDQMSLNDSTEGRWLTPDPLGGDITNPQSLNRPEQAGIFGYAYALNNPTTLTDPLGLDSMPYQPPTVVNVYDRSGQQQQGYRAQQ